MRAGSRGGGVAPPYRVGRGLVVCSGGGDGRVAAIEVRCLAGRKEEKMTLA